MANLGELRGVKERFAAFFRGIDRGNVDELVNKASGVSSQFAREELQQVVRRFSKRKQRAEFSRQVDLIQRAIMLEANVTREQLSKLPPETKLGPIANELYIHLTNWVEEEVRPFTSYFTHGD